MDRRDSIKSIMLGSIGLGVLLEGCVSGVGSEEVKKAISKFKYFKKIFHNFKIKKLREKFAFISKNM